MDHGVDSMRLLDAAVANNASWCDAVCRSHGYPGTFSSRLWASTRHRLRFYPNAITLHPRVTETEAGFHVLGTLRIWVRPSRGPRAAHVSEE